MKNILFVAREPLTRVTTLSSKFQGQRDALTSLGNCVWHLGWDNKFMYLLSPDGKQIKIKRIFPKLPGYFHTFSYLDLYLGVIKAIDMTHFDFIYMRHSPIFATTALMARKAASAGIPLVCEIPSFPPEKEKPRSIPRKLFCIYSQLWGKAFHSNVALFTLIGEKSVGTLYGKSAINIENGINVETIPIRKPQPSEESVHLLALGAMCPWHGFDRLINAVANYKGKPPVIVHMVGGNSGGALDGWRALVDDLALNETVLFHGSLFEDKLTEMFDTCDLGIGVIGGYRKECFSGTPLKNREYMARGLPFVNGIEDPALPDNQEFCLNVPNDNSPLDVNDIVSFALCTRNDPSLPKNMRKYAEKYMSWEAQFRKVFQALDTLGN